MDKNELKVQALREKIAQLVTQYEDQAADYRVEITILSSQIQQLQQENESLRGQASEDVTTEE